MKRKLGIIFGGRSGEHEISIRSAATVIAEADPDKFDLLPVAISENGSWLSPADSCALFPSETRDLIQSRFGEMPDTVHRITGDASIGGFLADGGEVIKVDCVFPVLHGTFGEDGTIQGLLEMAGLAYIGCGVLGSSCGMDKVVMKTLFRDAGLPIGEYVWFLRSEWERAADVIVSQIESKLGFPCFVKPANLGSSVGISRAENTDGLRAAIDLAAEYDAKIIVEAGLDVREIECAVLGNDDPAASEPGEYLIRDQTKAFLDYTEKYSATGNNEFVVPAPLSAELSAKIRKMAAEAFKAVNGSGLARVDFFVRRDTGALILNEINTMPGLTDASGFPKMWAGSGKPFRQVIDELVELAIERFNDKARNKTAR
nr:HipA-like C-terminal domain protein [uncultured bacterium]